MKTKIDNGAKEQQWNMKIEIKSLGYNACGIQTK